MRKIDQFPVCPEDIARWFCLNGATCFQVKIDNSTLYNCWCLDGYHGLRCDQKYSSVYNEKSKQMDEEHQTLTGSMRQAGQSGQAAAARFVTINDLILAPAHPHTPNSAHFRSYLHNHLSIYWIPLIFLIIIISIIIVIM